jgi:hypothetical protein
MREPAWQLSHSVQLVWPVADWKNPMVHSEQAPAPMPLANVPTAHSVQVLAPGLPPMFVTDPVAHVVHASMFDAAEYSPATHAVQLVAPA